MRNKFFNLSIPYSLLLTPYSLLLILLTAYTLYFSVYTIQRHQNLHSYAADLSLIDQPMWNTARWSGGFMELTWGEQQQPRLAEHFEPLLIPLSGLFWLWPDVRILLIAQTLALALGAIPVYWLARAQFQGENDFTAATLALIMVTVYLLSPHMQAANVADFHADPFAVTPLLLAFWSAHQRHWGRMWLWAIVVMATKEPLPTLTAMLGVWLIITSKPVRFSDTHKHGLALIIVSTTWFLVATFIIVAPLARHYFGTPGPIYFANRYGAETSQFWADPDRWYYALGLLASMGFLPLLAPDILLLGLPVFLANVMSNFSGQYSGEQHYSVPLVVALIIATIYGTQRALTLWLKFRPAHANQTSGLLLCISLWLLTWSLGYHIRHGWTPLSSRTENYATSPAAQILPRLLAQIPDEVAVSASAALHPHIAHRRVAYIFPTVATAEYLLIDVTDIPGTHPYDAHNQLETMLSHDWQLLDADQGLILARKSPHGDTNPKLPASFFDFARQTPPNPLTTPLNFGDGQLRLVGYTIHDDRDNGVSFQFYWQATAPLPKTLQLWPVLYDEWGNLLNDPAQVPMIATVWYPPSQWQLGETIMTETLPQLMPDSFEVGITVGFNEGFHDPAQHWAVSGQTFAHLATCQRAGLFLNCLPPPTAAQPLNLVFSQTLQLNDIKIDRQGLIDLQGFKNLAGLDKPSLPLVLTWTAFQPPPLDYTVFIHLLDEHDQLISQSDQSPTWLWTQPTSRWQPQQSYRDRHTLTLPAQLLPGRYRLKIGLYDRQTLQRLILPDGSDSYDIELNP